MGRISYAVVPLLCFIAVGGSVGPDIRQLGNHLQHFTEARHPGAQGGEGGREAARSYIKDQMREYGLEVATHAFNTSLMLQGYAKTIVGENVIGVAEGAGRGPLVLLGADYDSSPERSPLENNGAGVAAMLEVARNYMNATGPESDFMRNATVLFVAFDLNTKEYNDASAGQPGSYHFLHQWLWPHLNQSLLRFGGAVILDSITRFNQDPNTQYLPEGFSQAFPQAFQRIKDEEMKGNFLALITRGTSQGNPITKAFTDNYMKHRKAGLVPLREMVLQTAAPITPNTIAMMNHQAHYHFWTFQPSDQHTALPALLLTDTDVYRQQSEECRTPCTSATFLTRQRQQALSLTCEGLIHTLLDLQAKRRTGEGSGGPSVVVTVAATWLMAGLALVLH